MAADGGGFDFPMAATAKRTKKKERTKEDDDEEAGRVKHFILFFNIMLWKLE